MSKTNSVAIDNERYQQIASADRATVRKGIEGLPRSALECWIQTPAGEEVISTAFARMPSYYVGGSLASPILVRWEIRFGERSRSFYLLIGDHTCSVENIPVDAQPTTELVLDGVSFIELASAAKTGFELLTAGQLHVRGDVGFAMRMESMFGLSSGAD